MGKNIPPIVGPRLMLSLAGVGDAERILATMDPTKAKNLQFFADNTSPTLEQEREYLCRMEESPTDYLFLIIRREDGAIIGTIGLHEYDWHHRTARFGALIFQKDDRGKGYGTEAIKLMLQFAFAVREVNKIYGKVFAENIRGRTLYARLGFLPEGVLREEYLLGGKFHDMVYISMLRRDYDAFVACEKER